MMKPQEDLPLFAATSPKYLSVSELNDLVKTTLEDNLDGVWAPMSYSPNLAACRC